MKKLLSTLFLLFFTIIFSQEYNFDRKCVNSSTRIRPKIGNENSWKSYIYFNTNNNNYYMSQKNDKLDNYYITDNSLKEVFALQYLNIKNPYYSFLNKKTFDYTYSEKEIGKIIIKELAEDEFLVQCFVNDDSKKTNLEVKFKLHKSKTPMIEIRFMDLGQIIHKKIYESLKERLNGNNFWILYAEVDYKNGYKFLYEFDNCEEIALNLKFN
jgi:hypothetical protein